MRTAAEFSRLFFSGLELVAPGVVLISDWRSAPGTLRPPDNEVMANGAVGRKPAA